MKESEIQATAAYLTGGMHAAIATNSASKGFIRVTDIEVNEPTSFVVTLASGLRLAVKVEVVEKPAREST